MAEEGMYPDEVERLPSAAAIAESMGCGVREQVVLSRLLITAKLLCIPQMAATKDGVTYKTGKYTYVPIGPEMLVLGKDNEVVGIQFDGETYSTDCVVPDQRTRLQALGTLMNMTGNSAAARAAFKKAGGLLKEVEGATAPRVLLKRPARETEESYR